jgi:ADP-dependent phosphofructokinase/glucokinase
MWSWFLKIWGNLKILFDCIPYSPYHQLSVVWTQRKLVLQEYIGRYRRNFAAWKDKPPIKIHRQKMVAIAEMTNNILNIISTIRNSVNMITHHLNLFRKNNCCINNHKIQNLLSSFICKYHAKSSSYNRWEKY